MCALIASHQRVDRDHLGGELAGFCGGLANLELSLDMFNVMNANHVLLQNEAIGTTWGRPTRILTPRIIRFGVTARF